MVVIVLGGVLCISYCCEAAVSKKGEFIENRMFLLHLNDLVGFVNSGR